TLVVSRHDGAAIEHHAGHVETEQSHRGSGDGFVASDEGNNAIKHVATADEFDGVGNEVAADERRFHAFGAHGDAVRDRDGVELHRRAAGFTDASFHVVRERAQVEIARHGLNPRVGDTDDGLLQILVGVTDSLEHGARRGAIRALRDGVTVEFHGGKITLYRKYYALRSCNVVMF